MNTSFIFILLAIIAVLAIVIVAMDHQEKKAEAKRLAAEAEEIKKAKAAAAAKSRRKPQPKKTEPKFNPKAVDRDKDGVIQEGTKFERPVEERNEVPKKPARRGRPKKGNGKKETKANGSKK